MCVVIVKLLAFIPLGALVLAQGLPPPYDLFTTWGPPGAVIALLMTRQLVTRAELEREKERGDRAEAQCDALTERIMSDVIPLVQDVQRTVAPTLSKLVEQVEELRRLFDRGSIRTDRDR